MDVRHCATPRAQGTARRVDDTGTGKNRYASTVEAPVCIYPTERKEEPKNRHQCASFADQLVGSCGWVQWCDRKRTALLVCRSGLGFGVGRDVIPRSADNASKERKE